MPCKLFLTVQQAHTVFPENMVCGPFYAWNVDSPSRYQKSRFRQRWELLGAVGVYVLAEALEEEQDSRMEREGKDRQGFISELHKYYNTDGNSTLGRCIWWCQLSVDAPTVEYCQSGKNVFSLRFKENSRTCTPVCYGCRFEATGLISQLRILIRTHPFWPTRRQS